MKVHRRDVAWSYASLVLTSGVNVLLLPLILWALTPAEVGMWYLFSAIGGLTLVLDMGLMTTLARQVTFVWSGASEIRASGFAESSTGSPNFRLLGQILRAARFAYATLGLAVLGLALTFGSAHVRGLLSGIEAHNELMIAWFIYAFAMWLNMAFSYWNPVLRGIGRVAESGMANVAGKVAQLVLTATALVLGFGLIGVAASFLVSSFVFRMLSRRFFMNQAREGLRGDVESASASSVWQTLRIIWPNSLRQGLVSLAQYGLSYGPVLVASALLSLSQVAILGLTVQVIGLIKVFGNTMFNVYQPVFGHLRLTHDVSGMRERFADAVGISTWAILGLGALALLGSAPLLDVLGSDVHLLPAAPGLVYLFGELLVNQVALSTGFLATANIVPMTRAYVVSVAIAIGGQVVGVSILGLGIWGIVLPTGLCMLAYSSWYWWCRASSELETSCLGLLRLSLTQPFTRLARRV